MIAKAYTEMNGKEKKQLMKAQQGELDAVILYRKLAELIDEDKNKALFLKIASDEGKHAGILRKYTGENLEPKNLKLLIVSGIYKVFGIKIMLKMLSKGEFKAAKNYSSLVKKFPNIQEIIKDENLHGELMRDIAINLK
jgi:rubrerythrin